jgi:probable DNA repair protein
MHDPILEAALARGATVVTPNKRLARELTSRHDRAQRAAGLATWPAARVLPWAPFVGDLVLAAQEAGLGLPMQRLSETQSAHVWERIVRRDLLAHPLVNADAAAQLAAQAWQDVHAYGSGGESWRGFAPNGPEVEAFVRWADAYARELGRLDAVDLALAADILVPLAKALPGADRLDIVLAAFTELTPQQERLLSAFADAGANIARTMASASPWPDANVQRIACAAPRDEIASALDWARAQVAGNPHLQAAVVVPDLAQRRFEIRAAAEDRLCAALQWPGRDGEDRPYDISIGEPLSDVPLVATALDLIALARGPLARQRAAVLLRSPYLPDAASAWIARSSLERGWLERGLRELTLRALIDALARADRNLASRWERAMRTLPPTTRASPRAWVERWRGWLGSLGWCEGRALSSAEFQAQGAWNELLATFARLAAVAPALSAGDAFATLVALAGKQLFQPEAPAAQIRILGLLEASGLAFDALWVTGMAADAWPRTPQPNPLLPMAWQRERGVPRSTPQQELAFARDLTRQFAQAAPEVVFSHATHVDDHRRAPSPLIAGLPEIAADTPSASTAESMFAARSRLESIADLQAPPIGEGVRLPGGAGLIEAQSECPFRAAGIYRLNAREWPTACIGLTPMERGTLLHAALGAFWKAAREHANLAAMDGAALARAVDDAVTQACLALPASRWEALPPAIAASEAGCLSALVFQWLDEIDRVRPPFRVVETELRTTLSLTGHPLEVRIDRVDSLQGGGVAIVDYKSGEAPKPARWFAPRPQGLQLGLYALALGQRAPQEPVRALVYAQLRPGELSQVGLVDNTTIWPRLPSAAEVKGHALADWDEATSRLAASIESLAAACTAGDAAIAPRDRNVCTNCHLAPACRIGATRDAAAEDHGDGADDA